MIFYLCNFCAAHTNFITQLSMLGSDDELLGLSSLQFGIVLNQQCSED